MKKKLQSFIKNPKAGLKRLIHYVVYKPKFRQYRWSDNVKDISDISCRHVSLGDYVRLGRRCRIQGITRYGDKHFTPKIDFGSYVSVAQDLYLTCASHISIGSNTAIAAYVTITDIDHSYFDPDIPIEQQEITVEDVSIGEDCKIYNGAVILKGTNIGRHCVVGANSVVKGFFPDFCVIAGIPARIVKRYNTDTGKWERTDREGNFCEDKLKPI